MNSTKNIKGSGDLGTPHAPSNDGISLKLREYYESVEQEHIPDNLLSLLDKLEKAEKASLKILKGAPHERD